jgi:hypothetical protein
VNRLLLLIAGIIALGLYFMIAPLVLSTYRRFRGRRTIICPETGQIVEVELKAGRAGLMSIVGTQLARVKRCSLWPRKKGCAEECVQQYWQPPIENHSNSSDRNKLS